MANSNPDYVRVIPEILPKDYFLQFLRNSLGSEGMAVDGTTPVEFSYTIPASTRGGEALLLNKLVFYITDATITIDKFGGITALTNGLIARLELANGDIVQLFPRAVKNNGEFAFYSNQGLAQISKEVGSTNDALTATMNFAENGCKMILKPGDKVVATVQDNYTGLTGMCAIISGTWRGQ